ncbi:MAG: adenylate/guanylate cyclase domain-containing protein [Spirochaetia bacterium]
MAEKVQGEKKKRKKSKILETRYFGFIIATFIILLFLALSEFTAIIDNLEVKILDVHFRYKDLVRSEEVQEGVQVVRQNPDISQDILIVGIDFRTLSRVGRWPFPRYTHANLLDTFTRIQDQSQRERAVLLDIFFNEPSDNAVNDGVLLDSIERNQRVFLEPLLDEVPPPPEKKDDFINQLKILIDNFGEVDNIEGPWKDMIAFYGIQPPLKPYAEAAKGYGHPNYFKDVDETFRRQPMIAKYSEPLAEIPFRELTPETEVEEENYERLAWKDRDGKEHTIETPVSESQIDVLHETLEANAPVREVDTDKDGTIDDSYFVIYKYKDHFIPSITLSLALEYFNVDAKDVEIKIGEYIRIPEPQVFDTEKEEWEPYELILEAPKVNDEDEVVRQAKTRVMDEITIPIDEHGNMLINFMGPPSFSSPGARQTFPVRSYVGYSSNPPGPDPNTWPRTRALDNKIIMVGSFTRGMAADHKPTPYGLMYGVEVHANALNTVLMNNFLKYAPYWVNLLILIGLVYISALFASRLSTLWAFGVSLFLILALFLTSSIVFDREAYIINFTSPALATFLTFLSVVVYRVMTEERDKKRIRNMFGTYVSPKVVDQILDNPPELGGVDKELTVFFSDIRGFTTISESMTPQELVKILNTYLTAMTDIVLKYDGTLDKYEGDAIMCFWGAPVPQEDHALRACKCAVEQLHALNDLNQTVPEEHQLDIGIGLNSGRMTVGNMGSLQRMDYTLIGDNVNLGARLEGTNKEYQTRIIMSEHTYGLVSDYVIARELDNIRVKGKNRPVLIYELIDIKEEGEGDYIDKTEDSEK